VHFAQEIIAALQKLFDDLRKLAEQLWKQWNEKPGGDKAYEPIRRGKFAYANAPNGVKTVFHAEQFVPQYAHANSYYTQNGNKIEQNIPYDTAKYYVQTYGDAYEFDNKQPDGINRVYVPEQRN